MRIAFVVVAIVAPFVAFAARADDETRENLRRAQAELDKARRELQMEIEMIAAEEARAADERTKGLAEKTAGIEKKIEETRNRIQALQTRAVAPEALEGERRELEAEIARLEDVKAAFLAEADAARARASAELAGRKEEIARKMVELAVRERRIRHAAEGADGRDPSRGRENAAEGKRISANFQDTPLADCLAYLADQGGVNFVHAGSLEGETVTARLSDVLAIEAARAVLRAAGYKAEPGGENLLVIRGRDELAGLEAERDRLHLEIEILQLEAQRAQLEKELGDGD
ncbi:MAG: hypothetical protein HY720_12265 [Planctomycetes bacterium]|nr:hypothetical protein [Planctomycetota bacterium]